MLPQRTTFFPATKTYLEKFWACSASAAVVFWVWLPPDEGTMLTVVAPLVSVWSPDACPPADPDAYPPAGSDPWAPPALWLSPWSPWVSTRNPCYSRWLINNYDGRRTLSSKKELSIICSTSLVGCWWCLVLLSLIASSSLVITEWNSFINWGGLIFCYILSLVLSCSLITGGWLGLIFFN